MKINIVGQRRGHEECKAGKKLWKGQSEEGSGVGEPLSWRPVGGRNSPGARALNNPGGFQLKEPSPSEGDDSQNLCDNHSTRE